MKVRGLEYNGVHRTKKEWAALIGISDRSITERLNRGWPIEKALTLPRQTTGGDRRSAKFKTKGAAPCMRIG